MIITVAALMILVVLVPVASHNFYLWAVERHQGKSGAWAFAKAVVLIIPIFLLTVVVLLRTINF